MTALALVALLVTSGCLAAVQGNMTADEIGEKIEQKHAQIESVQGTQVVTYDAPNRTRTVTKNVVEIPNESLSRTEYVGDSDQADDVRVSNESTTWRYDASENTATRYDTAGGTSLTGYNYSRLVSNLQEDYALTHRGTETVAGRETHVVEFTATGNETVTTNGTLWVDTEYWYPIKQRSTMTYDGETRTTTVTFRNVTFNADVDRDAFRYDPPADATVEDYSTNDYTYEKYDSRSAAAEDAGFDLPDPSMPGEFSFANASVMHNDEQTSVTMTYTNGSAGITLRKYTTHSTRNGSSIDGATEVQLDGTTGWYQTNDHWSTLVWNCDDHRYTVYSDADLQKDDVVAIANSTGCR
ncbi:outer membrane lipoprotein-sorting protein [Halomicrococcus gelatinilyticus]|uniref:outer membrane lipoprotein-sorting protein n=1 Tax=Halomicrococcus gelatinilyticus TaxID=1702103 RepID=UPI002E112FAB